MTKGDILKIFELNTCSSEVDVPLTSDEEILDCIRFAKQLSDRFMDIYNDKEQENDGI